MKDDTADYTEIASAWIYAGMGLYRKCVENVMRETIERPAFGSGGQRSIQLCQENFC